MRALCDVHMSPPISIHSNNKISFCILFCIIMYKNFASVTCLFRRVSHTSLLPSMVGCVSKFLVCFHEIP